MADKQGKTGPASGIPEGYQSVTPFVSVHGAAGFIDYLKAAFGGEELGRVANPDGTLGHAEVRIGDSVVMMFDARPEWPDTPALLRLYVPDADKAYQRAVDAGGTSVTRPTDLPWGDRVARIRDPFGNIWWVQTRMEDLDEAEIGRRYGEKKYIDAMNYVQGADFFPGGKR